MPKPTPSINRTIRKHTGILPKDQNKKVVSLIGNTKENYKTLALLFDVLRECQKFETVSSRCKTPSDFLNMLPTMMSELETHNKKFKFEEPEITPEQAAKLFGDWD